MSSLALVQSAHRLLTLVPATMRDEALAVLNGAVGDRLHESEASTALPMELFARAEAGDSLAAIDLPALARTPRRTRVVLLIHGLMGSPHAWAIGAETTNRELGLAIADTIDPELLYLRYNSGRHISDNGRLLAEHLEALFEAWPQRLERLDLVAHSMGGLVARSALHYGLEAGHAWPSVVRSVVLLGTPSHGAPLEQLAHIAAFTLETIWNPWTKLIGKAINLRSAGIKDLRHGFCVEEDWRHKDQDVLRLQAPRATRCPAHVRWFAAAGMTGAPEHWVSRLVGDGLVRPPSVRGQGFGTPAPGALPDATVRVFANTGHIALMTDPMVIEQVLAWLSADD